MRASESAREQGREQGREYGQERRMHRFKTRRNNSPGVLSNIPPTYMTPINGLCSTGSRYFVLAFYFYFSFFVFRFLFSVIYASARFLFNGRRGTGRECDAEESKQPWCFPRNMRSTREHKYRVSGTTCGPDAWYSVCGDVRSGRQSGRYFAIDTIYL